MDIYYNALAPNEIPSEIVTISVDPVNGIVNVTVTLSLDVVGETVIKLDSEGKGLELGVTIAVKVDVGMLEVGGLVLEEVAVVVDLPDGGLVGGGLIGNVVFRAGHPGDLAVSRRAGQAICRESMPFQTTAG